MFGGGYVQGGVVQGGPPLTMGYGGQTSGTHPTGMHSCFNIFEEVICWFLES